MHWIASVVENCSAPTRVLIAAFTRSPDLEFSCRLMFASLVRRAGALKHRRRLHGLYYNAEAKVTYQQGRLPEARQLLANRGQKASVPLGLACARLLRSMALVCDAETAFRASPSLQMCAPRQRDAESTL